MYDRRNNMKTITSILINLRKWCWAHISLEHGSFKSTYTRRLKRTKATVRMHLSESIGEIEMFVYCQWNNFAAHTNSETFVCLFVLVARSMTKAKPANDGKKNIFQLWISMNRELKWLSRECEFSEILIRVDEKQWRSRKCHHRAKWTLANEAE